MFSQQGSGPGGGKSEGILDEELRALELHGERAGCCTNHFRFTGAFTAIRDAELERSSKVLARWTRKVRRRHGRPGAMVEVTATPARAGNEAAREDPRGNNAVLSRPTDRYPTVDVTGDLEQGR